MYFASLIYPSGPFTIFAPTNEAFDNLDKWTKAILARNVTALTEVLLFHLYDGYFKADAITNELKVPSKVKGLNIRLNTYGSVSTLGSMMRSNFPTQRRSVIYLFFVFITVIHD